MAEHHLIQIWHCHLVAQIKALELLVLPFLLYHTSIRSIDRGGTASTSLLNHQNQIWFYYPPPVQMGPPPWPSLVCICHMELATCIQSCYFPVFHLHLPVKLVMRFRVLAMTSLAGFLTSFHTTHILTV
jgi:hypothetical protein